MMGRIALVLIGFALLSISFQGQATTSNWGSTGMDEQALPILVNDSSLQFSLDKYSFFVLEGFANWCDNCKEMNVTLSKVSADLKGQVAFGQINAERNNETSEKYNITAYPTLLIFKNRLLVGTHEGYLSVPEFIRMIKRLVPDLDISQVKVTAGEWFNEGLALYDQSDYNNSTEAYGNALELDPKNESIWNNYGLSLYSMNKYDKAIKAYDRAIGINSSYADAWNNEGAALAVQGKYEEALEAFNKATEIDPTYAKAWNNEGKALKLLGRDAEANAAFAKAKELGYEPQFNLL
jgi:tetratricopeptide (TPR) repeat protein